MSLHATMASVFKVATHLNSGIGTKSMISALEDFMASEGLHYCPICAAVNHVHHLSNPDADKEL